MEVIPLPRVFCEKSPQLVDCKAFGCDKEGKEREKSPQRIEKAGCSGCILVRDGATGEGERGLRLAFWAITRHGSNIQ